MKGDYNYPQWVELGFLVRDDPHMKGDYNWRSQRANGEGVRDDPHMKGDYNHMFNPPFCHSRSR